MISGEDQTSSSFFNFRKSVQKIHKVSVSRDPGSKTAIETKSRHLIFLFCVSLSWKFTGKSFVIGNTALSHSPIIYCNEAFVSLFGWTRSEIMGLPVSCSFLFGPETNEQMIEDFEIGIRDREEYECEAILYPKQGKTSRRDVLSIDMLSNSLVYLIVMSALDTICSMISST
jgi:PAS domain-containing protein